MILVILTALTAVCGAAKLDKNILLPVSAKTAGGSPGALQAPFDGSNLSVEGLPSGGYTNDAQGVVVDAVNPGTRTSGAEPTGLGAPRISYGSTDSKVGSAAFEASSTNLGGVGPNTRIAPGFGSFVELEDGSEAGKTRGSALKFTNDVGSDKYSYGFETDNGISVGENGAAANGVEAQGGYSYKGDDGKTYSVTYTADKNGYKPHAVHLPTSPPIPEEILISLEKNAKEEAAGHVEDGSYDAQKYNDESDYSGSVAGNNNVKPIIGGGDATSSSFASQSNQAYRPSSGVLIGSYKPSSAVSHSTQGHGAQQVGQGAAIEQSTLGNKEQSGSQSLGVSGSSASNSGHNYGTHGQLVGSSHSTVNRFGVETTKSENNYVSGSSGVQSHANTLGSVSGSPVRTPNFNNLSGSSAYSSAVATGSGSASAFASTSSLGSGLKNEYVLPLNTFGSESQHTHGSKTSTGASFYTPSTATASASVTGAHSQHYTGSQHAYSSPVSIPDFQVHNQSPTAISSASASVSGNQQNFGQSSQHTGFDTALNNVPSRFGESQQTGHSASSSEYVPPVNIVESTGTSSHQTASGSSTANVQPLSLQSSAVPSSASGSSSFGISSQQSSFHTESLHSKPGQYSQTNKIPSSSSETSFGSSSSQFPSVKPTQPTLTFESISSQGPTKVPDTELTTPFIHTHESTGSAQHASVFGEQPTVSSPTSATFVSSSQGLSGQYKPQSSHGSGIHTGPTDASFASSTQQPAISQEQGIDDSYYYKQPLKPFVIPSVSSSGQYSNNHQPNFPVSSLPQQGSKYPNTPIKTSTGQYQSTGSGSYNGITQAAVSPFTSGSSSSSTQFVSQSSQFGSKPTGSTQFGQALTSQQSSTEIDKKPIVESQTSDSSLSSTQQYQGTIYQYNKPVVTLPAPDNKDTQVSQTSNSQDKADFTTDSRFGSQQGSSSGSNVQTSQFGQKPIVSSQTTGSNYQQSQFGSSISQFNQKPQTSFSSNSYTQTQQSQFVKKPTVSTQTVSYYQQTTPSSGISASPVTQGTTFGKKPVGSSQTTEFQQTQFSATGKPQTTQGSSLTTTASQSSFGQGSTQTGSYYQTQFGSSGSKFGQKPQTTQGQKPFGSTQTASSYQFGSSVSQLGQKQQTTQGASLTSNTFAQAQTSQFGKKPSGTTQTGSILPQTQFGSTVSQFSQKPQTQSSSFTSNTFSQGQTSQFGKQPSSSSTQTGSKFQQTQFGSQFGQTQQTTQGFGLASNTAQTSYGQKPAGSTYQQTQFGTTGSQFSQGQTSQFDKKPSTTTGSTFQQSQFTSTGLSQKPQTSQGSVVTSTTSQNAFSQKPVSSSYQQTQFGQTGSQFSQGQTSQFGKKPSTTTHTGSTFQQYQFGSTGSQFGAKPQTTQGSVVTTSSTSTYGQKPASSTFQQTQFGSSGAQAGQSQSSFTSNTFSQGQTSQYVKKPLTTQIGSTYQQTQFGSTGSQFGQKPVTSQSSGFTSGTFSQGQTSQFGKKPSSTTLTGSTFQSQFGSSGSQFAQKPQTTQGSSLTSTIAQTSFSQKPVGSTNQQTQFGSTGSQFSQGQTSQYGKQPSTTTTQQTGSAFQSQFGSSGSQFAQKPQTTQSSGTYTTSQTSFGQKPVSSTYQQTQFGTSGSQFSQGQTSQLGKKPQTAQGVALTSATSQSTFGQKPVGSTYQQAQLSTTSPQFSKQPSTTTQTGSTFQQSQFGSTGFSQNPQTSQGSVVTSTTSQTAFSQKPVGSSYQQTQFGTAGSQLNQKPLTSQSSSFTSNSYSQGQTSQFSKQPSTTQTGSTFQQTQFGSSGPQFGQKPQTQSSTLTSTTTQTTFSQKPVGSSYQQTQFGTTGSQFSQGQTSQFGKKPSTTTQAGSTFQQSQFGTTGYQFGVKPQTSQGSVVTSTTSQSTSGQKPVSSTYQQTQFGLTGSQFSQKPVTSQSSSIASNTIFSQGQTSQFVKKPFTTQTGSTYQQTQYGSTGSKFGQNQGTQGSGLTSTTSQTSFGLKPFSTGSTSQQTQFGSAGSQFGQKPTQGSAFTSSTAQTGSIFQQSQFGPTPSRFGENTQSTQGSSTSTIGQTSFSQKPASTLQAGSYYQQTQSGAIGSQFGQKPQTAQGSSYTTTTGSKDQAVETTQFGVTGSSENTVYNYPKPSDSSMTGSSSGSQIGQSSQTDQGATSTSQSQTVQTNQYGIKPFGISQNTQDSTQFGSTVSRFGEGSQSSQGNVPTFTTISQAVQPTQFGQKPFAQASAFASSSGSNVAQLGSTQSGQVSKYQQTSQFGVLGSSVGAQKPFGTTYTQTNYPQSQYKPIVSKFGQSQFGQSSQSNVESGQVGQNTLGFQSQKPFGSQSTQTSYQQNQFNQGQKPFVSSQDSATQVGQSAVVQTTQSSIETGSVVGQSALSSFGSTETGSGYDDKKQTVFTSQYGEQASGPQLIETNYNSPVSTSQTPINGQPLKPFGSSSSQSKFQQTQSSVGLTQFGAQPTKATNNGIQLVQTSYNKFSGQPFKPASTTSTQGSSYQSQGSSVSTSQFGLQPTKATEITSFSVQPSQTVTSQASGFGTQNFVSSTPFSVQPTQGVVITTQKPSQNQYSGESFKPSVFSTTQSPSFPSRLGSYLSAKPEVLSVYSGQPTIESVPGYEINTSSLGFAGQGEVFGGPRDPPRFDDKTGYYY